MAPATNTKNTSHPKISVIGIGNGGINTIDHIINQKLLPNLNFISVDSDPRTLKYTLAENRIQLTPVSDHEEVTLSEIEEAALHAKDILNEMVVGSDITFIIAGISGVTGTGAMPVISNIIRKLDKPVIGIVSTPYPFEQTDELSQEGLVKFRNKLNTLITVPNSALSNHLERDIGLSNAFIYTNEILREVLTCAIQLICDKNPAFIKIKYRDWVAVLQTGNKALFSQGWSSGENRAVKAIRNAVNCPLSDSSSYEEAAGILMNITTNDSLTVREWDIIHGEITSLIPKSAKLLINSSNDHTLNDTLKISCILTGVRDVC